MLVRRVCCGEWVMGLLPGFDLIVGQLMDPFCSTVTRHACQSGRIRVEHEDRLIWLGTSSGEFSLDQLTTLDGDRLLTNVARNMPETEACWLCSCVREDIGGQFILYDLRSGGLVIGAGLYCSQLCVGGYGNGGTKWPLRGTAGHSFCDIVLAELWGIFHGCKLAWNAGIRSVVIKSDSEASVRMIQHGVGSCHPLFSIFEGIHHFLQKDWQWKLSHVPREVNFVADWLADDSLSRERDLVPRVLLACISRCSGVAFPKLIP
ncbi:hypothetical protein Gohar_008599 [Gossypium harknessii]|uniref:RNase H type-1 domain-containing protein n=1 Tax=Gossypium harknessii TaxID=34285 RepID=A0A7J9GK71_9ROSI|nr:hypothetical protein [Gossypium harknessii]